ncbi:MAG: murein transglycosylase domain-containing protein [Litorilituus sp.]|jgi:membrane-bound lytic murein transglycosylase C|nr:murein transglycosylase domain-containing protein [Litorilituus sp.]
MKKQLIICLAIFSLFSPYAMAHNNEDAVEFEQYLKQQQQEFSTYQQNIDKEFAEFVQAWKQAEGKYKAKISQKWQQPKLPSQKQWVGYSDDLNQRTTVDFDSGAITVEVHQSLTSEQVSALAKKTISKLTNTSVSDTLAKDPIVQSVNEQLEKNDKQLAITSNSTPLLAKKHIGELSRITSQSQQAKTVITIPLRPSLLSENAQRYYPLAQKQAIKWNIPTSLILAIIHTESSFNPLARSHIPAFGLMQIVPSSAGKDVTKFLTGKMSVLSPTQLYSAEQNIEAGSVYLHLLMSRYFKHVTDNKNKLYMAIAGYNTGPGNVARAISNSTSLTRATKAANKQTSQQLYFQLLDNLPHQETVNYLQKVLKRTTYYNNLLTKEST